jgi:hypothetical protein
VYLGGEQGAEIRRNIVRARSVRSELLINEGSIRSGARAVIPACRNFDFHPAHTRELARGVFSSFFVINVGRWLVLLWIRCKYEKL